MLSITKASKKDGVKKYFSMSPARLGKQYLYPKEELLSAVSFEEKSIEDGLLEIQAENKIILCRNFWKYLSKEDLAKSSWALGEKIDQNTLVIIGDFDLARGSELPYFISALGLERISGKEDERNILRLNPSKKNIIATSNYQNWKKYVESKYLSYTPPFVMKK